MSNKLKHLEEINLHLESQAKETQKLFKTIVDSTLDLIWTIDANEKYTFLNQSWLSYTGQSLAEGLKENWRDRIHPEDLAECVEVYNSALKKCQGFKIEYRLRRFDDSYRTILNTAVRQHNEEGEFAGLLCSCSDITQRKITELKIAKQVQVERILTDIIQDIHSSLDIDLILQTATEKVNQYLSADRIFITKIINKNQLTLLFESEGGSFFTGCDLTKAKQLPNKDLIDNFTKLSQGEIIAANNISLTTMINIDSYDLPRASFALLLVPIIANQKLWGLVCVEQYLPPRSWELDEIKLLKQVAIQLGVAIKQSEMYRELEQLAVIDGLTKIANRRKFDRYLATEWKRLTREKNPLSLILCDIDYFKLYNDTYGHQAGDLCLQKVAQAISKALKRPADLVARYGGEEFAVILPNTEIGGAISLAEQIRLQVQSLKIPHINSPVDLYITLSFGVSSSIPSSGLGFYTLVAAADKGLYQAKELGRNRVVKFDLNEF
ncbi:diguanylate cyclase [Waterburya agarophytonicola K14]|uniref:Diguanylate cyclase n=1 Tax=Waterburya agarophytonicola KI4 TaxID=2874699 RepID=A0A964BUL2_9CYAN|nr:diguanylate cyclase [Waterburya agarophytonicola]MCC0179790.1 diguanylate cyclase [Waterburya agarophytonicola KI4]